MRHEAIPLTWAERTVLHALAEAAANGMPCPNYLDLNELVGFESSSASPGVVKRLEQKGLIVVMRYQRFRRVKINATGQWTARHESQRSVRKHVPRGAGSMAGKLAKKARSM